MSTLEQLPDNAGVLICGHGSRAKIAEREFSLLAKGLRDRHPSLKVEYGFLEYSSPNMHMALDRLMAQGVEKIYAVPGMLFAATHAQNDIPSVLTTYQEKHLGLTIEYGQELGLHTEMVQAFQIRILEALGLEHVHDGDLYDTMLVVVGRGTSVSEANAEAAKLTRIVSENLGFGWSETVYSGVTYPSVGRGLEMAVKLGFKKIVVAPYFLFGGKLIDRIYAYTDKVAAENPDITFMKAGYLKDQAHVINTFTQRIEETIAGPAPALNLMQNFKRRLALGEVDVHHHHAEFQPESAAEAHKHADEKHEHAHPHEHKHEGGHEHGHGHSHSHGHSHAPYKHIGHPHGPRTMIHENVCCCFMGQFPQHIIDEEMANKVEIPGTPSCKKN
ncbi:sirohydrochlorin chelatase [Marinagarivorans algicola]|uniref:sirohydrochlorin chelatase n=1 Tax=Marinagarivorans algicola TaxID=1513270 RepID=UPI0006B5BDC1|nr:sirohydrochlorin chelatase [Marinagarivorans algicola]